MVVDTLVHISYEVEIGAKIGLYLFFWVYNCASCLNTKKVPILASTMDTYDYDRDYNIDNTIKC